MAPKKSHLQPNMTAFLHDNTYKMEALEVASSVPNIKQRLGPKKFYKNRAGTRVAKRRLHAAEKALAAERLKNEWLQNMPVTNVQGINNGHGNIVINFSNNPDLTLNHRRTAPVDIHSSNRTQNLPRKNVDTRNNDRYKSPNYNFKRSNRFYGYTNYNRNDHKNNTQQQHFKYNTNYNEHTPHTNHRNKWHNKKSRNQNLQKYKKNENQNEQSFGDRRLDDARRFSKFRQERHQIDENTEPKKKNVEHKENLVNHKEKDLITFP